MQHFRYVTPEHSLRNRRSRLTVGLPLIYLIALVGSCPDAAAQSTIYRCTAEDGAIEFRQFPCHERDASRELELDTPPVGWVPPKPEATPKPAQRAKGARKTETRSTLRKDRYADQCWKKRQQMEEINARLRHGYRPDQGVTLRRRRSQHEEFIRQFCR
jgi:hypothetical protein